MSSRTNAVSPNRSSVLDQHGEDGEAASRRARGQHGQVPLSGGRKPHPHHEVAEERQGLQTGASNRRLQGRAAPSDSSLSSFSVCSFSKWSGVRRTRRDGEHPSRDGDRSFPRLLLKESTSARTCLDSRHNPHLHCSLYEARLIAEGSKVESLFSICFMVYKTKAAAECAGAGCAHAPPARGLPAPCSVRATRLRGRERSVSLSVCRVQAALRTEMTEHSCWGLKWATVSLVPVDTVRAVVSPFSKCRLSTILGAG